VQIRAFSMYCRKQLLVKTVWFLSVSRLRGTTVAKDDHMRGVTIAGDDGWSEMDILRGLVAVDR
jgi:hypothetical protein